MKSHQYFSQAQLDHIHAAINDAELQTSGELRLFIDDHCKINVLEKAASVFEKLEIHKTKERNGVLIYLSLNDRKFAIIGDAGIHEKVQPDFWNETKEMMLMHFIRNEVSEGLIAGITKAGEALSTYFPRQKDDANELSNQIVFGK